MKTDRRSHSQDRLRDASPDVLVTDHPDVAPKPPSQIGIGQRQDQQQRQHHNFQGHFEMPQPVQYINRNDGRHQMATKVASELVVNGLKNLMALAAETDVSFKEAEKLKEYLKDPSKFAAAVAPAAKAASPKKEEPKKKEEKKEESAEEDDGGFGGLFD
jgi:large subunit ribosomal protein LP0